MYDCFLYSWFWQREAGSETSQVSYMKEKETSEQ